MSEFKQFRFWCQSVIPLVYDDSLSYYEVLCKVVDYINNTIGDATTIVDEVEELTKEIAEIEEMINNFDTTYIENIIAEHIATMVFFGLTDDGYFIAYIPESWDDIEFQTTGYDTTVSSMPEFGHLCLAY